MLTILLNVLLVLAGCVAMLAGIFFCVWVLVHLLAPMTEDKEPPPPRSAVEDR